jgi:putative membrane protein
MALLSAMPWRSSPADVPVALLLWTWLGSTLANAAFFGRPGTAAVGFVGMGVVGVPLLRRLT